VIPYVELFSFSSLPCHDFSPYLMNDGSLLPPFGTFFGSNMEKSKCHKANATNKCEDAETIIAPLVRYAWLKIAKYK
jgi:hypothetical protein